jgi:hypothetical protein
MNELGFEDETRMATLPFIKKGKKGRFGLRTGSIKAIDSVMCFHATDLLSKFGFGDGAQLNDFVCEFGYSCSFNDLLMTVVEQKVLPSLAQEVIVETYEGGWMHNPIVATQVDGMAVDYHEDNRHVVLSPALIFVSERELHTLAKQLMATPRSQS